MLRTATVPTHEIHCIQQIEPVDSGTVFVLAGGARVLLPSSHSDRSLLLLQAQACLKRGCPAGLIVDGNGQVVDLTPAERSLVREVRPAEDGQGLEVSFWASPSVDRLPLDHPDFERIEATVRAALAAKEQVWFATRTWPVSNETELWNVILDVRDTKVAL
jgi:hypothetical protein